MRFSVRSIELVEWCGRFPKVSVVVFDNGSKEELPPITITIRKLLSDGDGNAKLAKNPHGKLIVTAGLSMLPATAAGLGNLCGDETAACFASCLAHQGRAAIWPTITAGRAARAYLWVHHREWFLDQLDREISSRKAKLPLDHTLAVRLNMFTDIYWEREAPELLDKHADVTFYDYSKHRDRGHGWIRENYYLAISDADNRSDSENLHILRTGGTVVKVYATAEHFPVAWNGFPVVVGDEDDFRFLDPPGSIVALKLKAHSHVERDKALARGFVHV